MTPLRPIQQRALALSENHPHAVVLLIIFLITFPTIAGGFGLYKLNEYARTTRELVVKVAHQQVQLNKQQMQLNEQQHSISKEAHARDVKLCGTSNDARQALRNLLVAVINATRDDPTASAQEKERSIVFFKEQLSKIKIVNCSKA